MGYRVIAGVVVGIHYAFLAYVVVGGFVALRWRWTIWTHLAAIAWAVAILTVPGLVCPLTIAENWARERAGYASYNTGFIDRYVENVLYPARFTPLVQVLVAIAVLTSWYLFVQARRRTRRDQLSRKPADVRRA